MSISVKLDEMMAIIEETSTTFKEPSYCEYNNEFSMFNQMKLYLLNYLLWKTKYQNVNDILRSKLKQKSLTETKN